MSNEATRNRHASSADHSVPNRTITACFSNDFAISGLGFATGSRSQTTVRASYRTCATPGTIDSASRLPHPGIETERLGSVDAQQRTSADVCRVCSGRLGGCARASRCRWACVGSRSLRSMKSTSHSPSSVRASNRPCIRARRPAFSMPAIRAFLEAGIPHCGETSLHVWPRHGASTRRPTFEPPMAGSTTQRVFSISRKRWCSRLRTQ